MKEGILAIYDKETNYACQLMEYLNQRQNFLLEAKVFTNLIHLKEYLEENQVEILLIGEGIDMEQLPKKQISHIIILTEYSMVRETGEYPFLYKLQSMEDIVKELAVYYATSGFCVFPNTVAVERNMQLIGVFSPFGGSGKTLFSLAMGQVLAKSKKVLYIGMENISSFKEGENIRGNLSDILYWVTERKEGSVEKISLMAERKGNLECIFSPDYYEDLNTINEEDMYFFLEELYKNQFYEVIIFDIGFWNHMTFSWLEQMDFIYMPDFLNRAFLKKEASLLDSMKLMDKERLYEKIETVRLPFDQGIYEGNYTMDRLEKTEMGQYVCRLIKKNFL